MKRKSGKSRPLTTTTTTNKNWKKSQYYSCYLTATAAAAAAARRTIACNRSRGGGHVQIDAGQFTIAVVAGVGVVVVAAIPLVYRDVVARSTVIVREIRRYMNIVLRGERESSYLVGDDRMSVW